MAFDFLYNWVFWVVAVIIALIVLWIFFGGDKHYHLADGSVTRSRPNEEFILLSRDEVKERKKRRKRREETAETSSYTSDYQMPSQPPQGVCWMGDRQKRGIPPGVGVPSQDERYGARRPPALPSFPSARTSPNQGGISMAYPQPEERVPVRTSEMAIARRTAIEMSGDGETGIYSSREAILPLPSKGKPILGGQPILPDHIANLTPKGPQDSRKEYIVRDALMRIYGVPFKTVWPEWLRNPKTGRKLQIDLYNEELKLGVEVHGPQHYAYTPRFHKTEEDFRKQVERDNVKLDICDKRGVYIITMPDTVADDKVEEYIRHYDPSTVAMRRAREITVAKEQKAIQRKGRK